MKHSLSILTAVFAVLAFLVSCGGSESSTPGSIYGVVSDKATGEPIQNAGVELLPVGLKTVTGSDGSFEFLDISSGHYNLLVTKTGYSDTKSSTITVESGKQSKGDVQLEKAPAALRIVDDARKDISELDFGARLDDVSRAFNIFNDSPDSLEWKITRTAEWIKSVSEENGNLKAGETQPIIVVIDRSLLREGENLTQLHITATNNGNKQLAIKATNSDVVTLDATNIKTASATLNGELIRDDVDYTETGFVYGGMATPSFDNNAKTVSNSAVRLGSFGNAVSGLSNYTKYYYRAYAKNDTNTVYGETKSFVTLRASEYVTVPGTNLVVAKEDAGKVGRDSAVSLCKNSTLAGFTDWYLPTEEELVTVYNNKDSIGSFEDFVYWSSTVDNGKYRVVDFRSGGTYNASSLYNHYFVRCVRAAK